MGLTSRKNVIGKEQSGTGDGKDSLGRGVTGIEIKRVSTKAPAVKAKNVVGKPDKGGKDPADRIVACSDREGINKRMCLAIEEDKSLAVDPPGSCKDYSVIKYTGKRRGEKY